MAEEEEPKKKSNIMTILIFVVAGFVLVGVGLGVGFLVFGGSQSNPEDIANEIVAQKQGEVAEEEEESSLERQEVEVEADDDVAAADDDGSTISKLYDPLLNMSIILMAMICILLVKKGIDLSAELNELRSMSIGDDNSVNVDIASASSSAAEL